MKRRTFDGLITTVGFGLTVFLFIAAGLLNWGYTFADSTVKSQLQAQQIIMPSKTMNPKEAASVTAFFKERGGKLMSTGQDAQMYADHYLGFHLSKMPTYAEISTTSRADASAASMNPNDAALQAKAAASAATLDTVFKGTMLKGTLLVAYAFGTFGMLAKYGALACLLAGLLFLALSVLGLGHRAKTPEHVTI